MAAFPPQGVGMPCVVVFSAHETKCGVPSEPRSEQAVVKAGHKARCAGAQPDVSTLSPAALSSTWARRELCRSRVSDAPGLCGTEQPSWSRAQEHFLQLDVGAVGLFGFFQVVLMSFFIFLIFFLRLLLIHAVLCPHPIEQNFAPTPEVCKS